MNFEKDLNIISFPEIALEIRQMVDNDQAMRERDLQQGDAWDDEIDVRNTAKMKAIVASIGWPTVSKVGKEGSENAWLLVQHADQEVDFQVLCLELMKNESNTEVSKHDIAYLEDRIRVNQGRGQLYGTQFRQENNQHIPEPIEDEENVDARRAHMDIGPLSQQIQDMYSKYPFEDKG